MIVVDTGSSRNSAVKPKAPPTAPVPAAASLCQRVDAARPGTLAMLHSAACADLYSAASTAPWIRADTFSGSARTAYSRGAPTRLAMRAVIVGASSSSTARRSSARSKLSAPRPFALARAWVMPAILPSPAWPVPTGGWTQPGSRDGRRPRQLAHEATVVAELVDRIAHVADRGMR